MPCLSLTLVCPGGAGEAGRTPGVALLHTASHLENSQLAGEGQVGGFALNLVSLGTTESVMDVASVGLG